jgi:hypothetical protein
MWIKQTLQIVIYIFALIGFILVAGYFAVRFGWTNTPGIIDTQDEYFKKNQASTPPEVLGAQYVWAYGEEWTVFKEAVIRDKADIYRAANAADVNPRLIVANLAVEQLRLFHTNREIFKTVFAPLKLLGNQSQFSWGVMGLKQDTAKNIEINLKNPGSPYYLGQKYEKILDFQSKEENSQNSERFQRIIDENSRYYSYLYAALHLKQLETQWQKAGFPISDKPGILSTLFNIGFQHSRPNPEPKIGGAPIEIHGKTYSFGGLAEEFYDSTELQAEFPL